MPDTMIERMARALGEQYDGYADPVETPNNWRRAENAARAILTAMREPTELMAAEGESSLSLNSGGTLPQFGNEARDCWQHMIDAALAEER